ncbi:MAG: hypothetical protein JWO87_338 [Phycisphaerales bacterium]|nr:hypothetical protein [Phycisphaerales bacterium]
MKSWAYNPLGVAFELRGSMRDPDPPAALNYSRTDRPSALRLVRVIVLETILVAIGGTLVWGLAWEAGFFWPGLIAAIVIWLTVSPVIEVATVLRYRREGSGREGSQ